MFFVAREKDPVTYARQRLLNLDRSEGRPFNEILQCYALERFLFRLSPSDYLNSFILKGAMMWRVWRAQGFRPTMDVDLLGRTAGVSKYGNLSRGIQGPRDLPPIRNYQMTLSKRRKESVIPRYFWFASLVGSLIHMCNLWFRWNHCRAAA